MNTFLMTALLPFGCGEGTMPPPPPAPLLFVRVVAPEGTHIVFRPATPEARAFAAPAIAGFRPGYGYRLQLTDIPEQAGRVLSPSIEVLDTLHVPPGLKAEDFPATVTFIEDDLRRAASGGLVTKIVYLEDPMQAPAVRSTPTQPVELEVMPGHDPLAEARLRGRPMMIVRLGEREVPPAELLALAVPGTVLVPGDPALPPPACPPTLPCRGGNGSTRSSGLASRWRRSSPTAATSARGSGWTRRANLPAWGRPTRPRNTDTATARGG